MTEHSPKPLLPLLGRPLIGIMLGKLTSICDGKIGVNLHHKPEKVEAWFKTSPYADQVTALHCPYLNASVVKSPCI